MSEPDAAAASPKAAVRRMDGKIRLVTGGSSGIGRAAARKMTEEGATAVVIAGRREAEIESAAAECRALGTQALAIRADVTQEDDVERVVRTTVEHYGRLDVALNNAGFQERRAPVEQQVSSVYDEVFATNVRSVLLCLRHQLPVMFAHGNGRIVINASVSGIRNPNPGLSLYSASKAAVISLMRSVAMEAAPSGVRINAIAPGPCRYRHDASLRRRRYVRCRSGAAAATDGKARGSRRGRGVASFRRRILCRWSRAGRGRRFLGLLSEASVFACDRHTPRSARRRGESASCGRPASPGSAPAARRPPSQARQELLPGPRP